MSENFAKRRDAVSAKVCNDRPLLPANIIHIRQIYYRRKWHHLLKTRFSADFDAFYHTAQI